MSFSEVFFYLQIASSFFFSFVFFFHADCYRNTYRKKNYIYIYVCVYIYYENNS